MLLIQKYLSVVPLNFVGLYNAHFQQSNLRSAVLIISDFFVQSFMLCLLKRPCFSNSEKLTSCPGEHIQYRWEQFEHWML